jgi:predicted RNase H-like HicB family nuclease
MNTQREMHMADKKTFKAKFTRQGRDWLVELVDEPRVHTFGRTLSKAGAMIVDATALWYELDVDEVDIVGDIYLGGDLDDTVRQAVAARKAAEGIRRDENEKVAEAVEKLTDAGVSFRDIASLLGISHQRIQQIHAAWTNAV